MKTQKIIFAAGISALALTLTGCKLMKPVKSRTDVISTFDLNSYLGKWYEICRLDFFWEKGLSQVTAEYSMKKNGMVEVKNRGFNDKKQKWSQSIGKAKPIDSQEKGTLKVSFFGPFYSAYNIVKIDPEYKYALVFGRNTDYMWILSREKTIPERIKQEYVEYAHQAGYDTTKLVWTRQE